MKKTMHSLITIPKVLSDALKAGADFSVSFSGGKDSLAMLILLATHPDRHMWTGKFYALHADLGVAEWSETHAFCKQFCEGLGVELITVKRTDGADLIDYIEAKAVKYDGLDKPAFPSAAIRYCTSDLKRAPLNKEMRKSSIVISAEGIRADESTARKKKQPYEVRRMLASDRLTHESAEAHWSEHQAHHANNEALVADGKKAVPARAAFDYRPIFNLTEAQVWQVIGTSLEELNQRRGIYSMALEMIIEGEIDVATFQDLKAKALDGWIAHPAYVYGNDRLSCSLCVLANKNDLLNGAIHNPEAFERLKQVERDTGYTFKAGWSLTELDEQVNKINDVMRPDAFALPLAA